MTLWSIMTQIAQAGDANGNRWSLSVGAGRRVNYVQTMNDLAYHIRAGKLYDVSGGEVDPYLTEPGWAQLDDVPVGPGSVTANANDDPRRIYLEELEYTAPAGLKFKRKVEYAE